MIEFNQIANIEERKRLVHALFIIGRMDETAPFMDWIKSESIRLAKGTCTPMEKTAMHHQQGMVRLLDELVRLIEGAREIRDRIHEG